MVRQDRGPGGAARACRTALAALFAGALGKAVVSRTWRKVKTDRDAWNGLDLGNEGIVRLILDGTVWSRRGSTARPPRSRSSGSSACAATAKGVAEAARSLPPGGSSSWA